MSLVENMARRQPSKTAIVQEIERLSAEKYSIVDIAKKTGYSPTYIGKLKMLIDRKERHFLTAVLSGKMPISVAITLSECNGDSEIQNYLNEAYENGEVKGKSLKYMKDILWRRKNGNKLKYKSKYNNETVIAECKAEIKRGVAFLKKVQRCENNLAYLKGALMKILDDSCFTDLMITQEITDIPEQIKR